jgi:hypothetical protein
MRRGALALVFAVALAILAAPCFAFDEVFQQTYPLPVGGSFQLQNVNGSVRVGGWDRNEVEVRAVKSARRNPRDLERVQIEVAARPDSVAVDTRYPQDAGVEVYVEYRIRVPHRVLLRRVATVNGAVYVSGVEASGELRSVNGNVEVFESSGRLSAATTNGNVRLELRELDPSGPLMAETVNGSVVLALSPDAGAELDVRSVNGDFHSELPVTLEGSLGSRQFKGRLGAGGSPLRIRTVNGGIRVVALRPIV